MSRSTTRLALGCVLATAAAVIPSSAAWADPGATYDPSATKRTNPDKARDYWTAKKLRNAEPLDLITKKSRKRAKPPKAGKPSSAPASFPDGGSPWTGGGKIKSTEGRVFFTYQGRDASCSGNAVTSTNGSTVMTAGHCVKLQGAYHTNWVFVPGYEDGSGPNGRWPATELITTPQWHSSEDINYDVAAAVVEQVGGQRLTDVVGGQGVAFNQARRQAMYAFGHPAASPYDGEKLIYCSGTAIDDFLLSNDHGLACDMTGGSSGGPWFVGFDEATGAGQQNSVNSFKYNFLPNYMFGPYFGTDAENVYNTAQAS